MSQPVMLATAETIIGRAMAPALRFENRRVRQAADQAQDPAEALLALAFELSVTLGDLSQCVNGKHRPTAHWIRQLGERLSQFAMAFALESPQPGQSQAFAERIGAFTEVASPLVRVNYLPPDQQAELSKQLARVERLAREVQTSSLTERVRVGT